MADTTENADNQLIIEVGARIGDFAKSLNDATSTASKAMATIEARGDQASKKLTASFAQVGTGAAPLSLVSKGLLTAEANAGKLAATLRGVKGQLDGLKGTTLTGFTKGSSTSAMDLLKEVQAAGSLKNFAALAGGPLGVGAIVAGQVASQTKQLAELQETADAARVTAAQVAGLQSVFGKLGIAAADASRLITTFADRLLDAKAHGGALKDALDAAGVSFMNADGSLRPTIAVLQDLIGKMRGSTDEAASLKIATAAVGETLAGPFATAVKQGGSALDNLQSATARVGSSITNDLARAAQSGMSSLDALWDKMNRIYSRAKELGGLSLTETDKINVAQQHLDEARGHLVQLRTMQSSDIFRQPSSGEMKEAWERYFAAGREVAKTSPIPTLAGGDPREKPATPKPAPAAVKAPDELPTTSHGAGRSRADEEDDRPAETIERLQRQLALVQAEGAERTKIKSEIETTSELKRAGVDLDSEAGRRISDLVGKINAATEAARRHKQEQAAVKQAVAGIGDALEGSIEDVLLNSSRLNEVFAGLAQQLARMALQAALLGQGPLGGLFGASASGGIFGAAVKLAGFSTGGEVGASSTPTLPGYASGGKIGGTGNPSPIRVPAFASGGSPSAPAGDAAPEKAFAALLRLAGYDGNGGGSIRGPGGPTADRIPAMLSAGEFVIRAEAAKANMPLLKFINEGGKWAPASTPASVPTRAAPALPRFATGGAVGAVKMPPIAAGAPGGVSLANSFAVTVNATGGAPAANADLGKQVAGQLKDMINKEIMGQIRQLSRPGNIMGRGGALFGR